MNAHRPRAALVLAALALGPGCSTITVVQRPPAPGEVEEINRAAARAGRMVVEYERPATSSSDAVEPLETTTELQQARLASADLHQLTFLPSKGPPLVLPTKDVRAVMIRNRSRGIVEGIVAGAVVAVLTGVLVRAADRPSECEICSPNTVPVLLGLLVGSATVPLGAWIGSTAGHRERFAFGEAP